MAVDRNMDDDLQQKIYEELAALKDLFLRRLMDDKVKSAAISRLTENNEALQAQLNDKAIYSLVKEILLICDRIDAQTEVDDMTLSVEEELLEILARRQFTRMPSPKVFDPAFHNAIGTTEATEDFPENSVVKIIKGGYMYRDRVFRPADVIVAVGK